MNVNHNVLVNKVVAVVVKFLLYDTINLRAFFLPLATFLKLSLGSPEFNQPSAAVVNNQLVRLAYKSSSKSAKRCLVAESLVPCLEARSARSIQ